MPVVLFERITTLIKQGGLADMIRLPTILLGVFLLVIAVGRVAAEKPITPLDPW